MSYEDYRKSLEGKHLLFVDWKCPKCGKPIEYATYSADGPSVYYVDNGRVMLADVLECDECGIRVIAQQEFEPRELFVRIEEKR